MGFRGVARDITTRQQMERELRQSEEKYRTILDIMDEGYFETDRAGEITFANVTACKLLGYRRAQLIGSSYRDFLSPHAAQSIREVFRSIYETGKPQRLIDYEITSPEGKAKTYQLNAAALQDEEEKISGFRVLTWDVTQRKSTEDALQESEKRYRLMTERMSDVIWTFDLDLQYAYVSPSNTRITGYTPEEVRDIPLNKILTPNPSPGRCKHCPRSWLPRKKRPAAQPAPFPNSGAGNHP